MSASIYLITNLINNKKYVGFTIENPPENRWIRHIKLSQHTSPKFYIHRAIKKYGVKNFKFEVIFTEEDPNHCLNIMESHYIQKFNTHCIDGHGYNMTYGGQGLLGHKHSEETILKLHFSHLKKNLTEQSLKNMSDAARNRTPWNKGKINIYSPETIIKFRNRQLGKKLSKEIRQKISKSTRDKLNHFYGKKHTEEAKLKISLKRKNRNNNIFQWKITFPDGKTQIVNNLKNFCQEKSLNFHSIYGYKGNPKRYKKFQFLKIGLVSRLCV